MQMHCHEFGTQSILKPMTIVFLCLGSNKGDKRRNIRTMKAEVLRFLSEPVKVSRLMKTEPVGVTGKQPWYLNCVISGKFSGSPKELLEQCGRLERNLGRTRDVRFAPRTADVDILMFGGALIRGRTLSIP